MTNDEQIKQLEKEATDLERLAHELGRLDCDAPASSARAMRLAGERREKLEQLRGATP